MPLLPTERDAIHQHADLILSMSESQLRKQANAPDSDLIAALTLGRDHPWHQFWIPFDWVNEAADVVIVGLTPGFQQAEEALASMRNSLLMKLDADKIAERAKSVGAFKGGMRSLGARLMDHFGIHELLELDSTDRLFGSESHRVHCTSLLRHPVLKNGKNYSGDERLMQRPFLSTIAKATLAGEIARIGDPWIVTFGSTVARVVEGMAAAGDIASGKLLTGLLHPSGTQWNRYNVQLDLVSPEEATQVPGGPDVIERSTRLREKIELALGRRVPSSR